MICIGHRGAAGLAPENTLLAIERAYETGVRTFEIDVRNVHGELLVFHDPTVDRVTAEHGRLTDYSVQELQEMDLGEAQRIPLLREILDSLPEETTINLELASHETARKVMELLEECQMDRRRVLISSFLHPELEIVRNLDANIKIAVLIGHHPQDLGFAIPLSPHAIAFELDYFNVEAVRMAKREGLLTMAYTVNEPRDMQEMKEMGLDAIFSDYPNHARPYCSFQSLLEAHA